MELPAEVTDPRLEHDHRNADATLRDTRHPPIPHYRDSPDAENRTTAIPGVP